MPKKFSLAFPLNIKEVFEALEQQFHALKTGLELIIVQEEDVDMCIATVQQFSIDYTLFMVPVAPLYHLLRGRKTQKAGELILSVFSYLYHDLNIPYHLDSYIGSCYEHMEQWVDEDDDFRTAEEYKETKGEYRNIYYLGELMLKKIRHPYNLQAFKQRLENFRCQGAADELLYTVCKRAFELHLQYPGQSICKNVRYKLLYPEDENRMYPDQYISFYHSSDNLLHDQLIEFINMDLQETMVVDSPVSIQRFDKPHTAITHDLQFETEAFMLLEDLADLLHKYPNE